MELAGKYRKALCELLGILEVSTLMKGHPALTPTHPTEEIMSRYRYTLIDDGDIVIALVVAAVVATVPYR
jgi:hypothetical protein